MNRHDLLGTTFDCNCGKSHHVPTDNLYYSIDALDYLEATIKSISKGGSVLIVADKRTFEVAGQLVEDKLKNGEFVVSSYIVQDKNGESPVTDDETCDHILKNAPEADIYIAVGSGVINDLVKWVAYLRKGPYVAVATAASMNGYASANVAATVKGLKKLFHAEACKAVFAVPEIIINAPDEMTTSGLGDVLAKSVSSADWKLNQFLFDDYYCQFSVDLLKDLEPVYLNNPKQILKKEPAGIRALFEALFYSSIAMTITGTSSPASGGEHLISHTLDMIADRDGRKHDFHGRQVGVSSILMAALYEKILQIKKPKFHSLPPSADRDFWGVLYPEVESEYKNKLPKMEKAAEFLSDPKNWQALVDLLQPNMISPDRLKNCLSQANAAHRISDIRDNSGPLDKNKFLSVVSHANQMRERFTVLDLASLLNIIPNGLEELVENWIVK